MFGCWRAERLRDCGKELNIDPEHKSRKRNCSDHSPTDKSREHLKTSTSNPSSNRSSLRTSVTYPTRLHRCSPRSIRRYMNIPHTRHPRNIRHNIIGIKPFVTTRHLQRLRRWFLLRILTATNRAPFRLILLHRNALCERRKCDWKFRGLADTFCSVTAGGFVDVVRPAEGDAVLSAPC